MNNAITFWSQASADLGIAVAHDIFLPGLEYIGPMETLIYCFGGVNGIIVVENYEKIFSFRRNLLVANYGYSVLSYDGDYSRGDLIEILKDWGWTCDQTPPSWY